MAKKKFDIGKLDYLNIRDIAFTYSMPDEPSLPEKEGNPTSYGMEIVKMFNMDQEIIRLVFTIQLETMLETAKGIKGVYTTEHLFQVKGLSEWVTKAEEKFVVDPDLNEMLTIQAYSTARGMIHQKFNGTWFSDFVLPVAKSGALD
jgi:hypothetical protein